MYEIYVQSKKIYLLNKFQNICSTGEKLAAPIVGRKLVRLIHVSIIHANFKPELKRK